MGYVECGIAYENQNVNLVGSAYLGGSYIVMWKNHYNHSDIIYSRKYSETGQSFGDKFLIDTGSQNLLTTPSMTGCLSSFLITWIGEDKDGLNYVYTRSFGGKNTPSTAIIQVTTIAQNYSEPIIGIDYYNCVYIIVWKNCLSDNCNIYARMYNPSGSSVGEQFLVASNITTIDGEPIINTDNLGGGFVIVWENSLNQDSNIYARMFYGNQAAVGPSFRVNENIEFNQTNPVVAADNLGAGFLVAWESIINSTECYIYARLFASNGNAFGSSFIVNDGLSGSHTSPIIKAKSLGQGSSFTIAWINCLDINTCNIYVRSYLGNGAAYTSAVKVNEKPVGQNITNLAIGADQSGTGYIVTWEESYTSGMNGIYSRIYGGKGLPIGSQFLANNYSDEICSYFKTNAPATLSPPTTTTTTSVPLPPPPPPSTTYAPSTTTGSPATDIPTTRVPSISVTSTPAESSNIEDHDYSLSITTLIIGMSILLIYE